MTFKDTFEHAVEGTETEAWKKRFDEMWNDSTVYNAGSFAAHKTKAFIEAELYATRADERKKLMEVVKGIKDELVYPPVPKGKKMTEDFMYVRGKAVALEDVLAKISQV